MDHFPKIGILTLTCPQEISPIPKEAVNIMKAYSGRAKDTLEKNNLKIFMIEDLVEDSSQALAKIEYLNHENIDVLIILIGSWPPPSVALQY